MKLLKLREKKYGQIFWKIKIPIKIRNIPQMFDLLKAIQNSLDK